MIEAEELFPRLDAPRTEEIQRLTKLQNRIPQEPLSVRTALGRDLLAVIKDAKGDVARRTLAGFKISAHAKDFDLINSKAASKTLMRVLRAEFFGEKIVFFWEKNKVKPLSSPLFALLSSLIASLYVINPEEGSKALRMACREIRQTKDREQLINLLKIKGLEIDGVE
jgi:hypothetical protein